MSSRTVTVTAQENMGIVSAMAAPRYNYSAQTEASLTQMRQLLTELASKERAEQELLAKNAGNGR